jgi:hypothetical protein
MFNWVFRPLVEWQGAIQAARANFSTEPVLEDRTAAKCGESTIQIQRVSYAEVRLAGSDPHPSSLPPSFHYSVIPLFLLHLHPFQRQGKVECGATVGIVVRPETAAVGLDDGATD